MMEKSLVFMGTPEIACPALEAAVKAGWQVKALVSQPDRPAGRGKKITRCAMAQMADQLGIMVLQPQKIAEVKDQLIELKASACLVMALGQILPKDILELFPLGCINLHTSLLPLLRGASPINQAIIQGFSKTGVSSMFMDTGLDTGDIIKQITIDIDPQETAGSLADRLSALAAEITPLTLDAVYQGKAQRTPQDNDLSTYAPLMKKSDGLLDFSDTASELDCRVRGMDPWPSAHTLYKGKMMKLFAPTCVSDFEHNLTPGSIISPLEDRNDLLWVACGKGALGLGQVQVAGKKRVSAGDFLRGQGANLPNKLGK